MTRMENQQRNVSSAMPALTLQLLDRTRAQGRAWVVWEGASRERGVSLVIVPKMF